MICKVRDIIMYILKSEAVKAGAMQLPPSFYISWRVIFVFTTIIEASLATYMISGQLSGFPIRYPDFKSTKRFPKVTLPYGVPPRKKHLEDIDELWLLSPKKVERVFLFLGKCLMGNVPFLYFLVNIKCYLRTKSNHFP